MCFWSSSEMLRNLLCSPLPHRCPAVDMSSSVVRFHHHYHCFAWFVYNRLLFIVSVALMSMYFNLSMFLSFHLSVLRAFMFLPCCMECRRSLALRILSVCLSGRLSNAWFVTKQKNVVNGIIALILRFFTKFDCFAGQLRHSDWRPSVILSVNYCLPVPVFHFWP